MEKFLYSTALAFIVYQIIAYAPPAFTERFVAKIGHGLGPRAVAWLRRDSFAALVALILYLLLLVHAWPFHIDTSSTRVNVIAGLFCGPLLAIWVNSVLNSPADKGLSKGQIAGLCGLAALAVLGSVGDNGADFLRKYANQITSLNLAGITQLQFAEKSRGDVTPPAPPPPTGTTQNADRIFAPSQGLQFASHLTHWFIDLDNYYLNWTKEPDLRKLDASRTFANEVIEPYLECLYRWSQEVPDDAPFTNQHLRVLAGLFRYLHDPKDPDHRKKFSKGFVNERQSLADDVRFFPKVLKARGKTGVTCEEFVKSEISPESIEKLIDNGEFEERPYLAIAHASLMAQLGQYPSSGAILGDWLDTHSQKETKTRADEWFDLRARSLLATYTEEWIEKNEAAVGTPLRNEHLKNLDNLLGGLRRTLKQSAFFSAVLQTAETAREDHSMPLMA